MMGDPPVKDLLKTALSDLDRLRDTAEVWSNYARALEKLIEESRDILGKFPAPEDPALASQLRSYLEKTRRRG